MEETLQNLYCEEDDSTSGGHLEVMWTLPSGRKE